MIEESGGRFYVYFKIRLSFTGGGIWALRIKFSYVALVS